MFDFLSQKFSGVLTWLKDKGRLTDENIAEATNQVKEALLEADVPHDLIESFLANIKTQIIGQKINTKLNPGQQLIKIVHDELLSFLGGKDNVVTSFQIPSVIMMMGLQGSGKTTSIAKIAHWVLKEAKKRNKTRKILFSSVDFYRPAAIDQLEILSKQVGVDFYRSESVDPLTAAKEAHRVFKEGGYAHLLLDTAGRLHIDNDMMEELKNIDIELSPKHKILVLDAMTGQESLKIAQAFEGAIGFDGAILSKMDSDTRGGAAFSFRYSLKKPIYFVGSGEKKDDLEAFIPERMASRILGMGDIQTLIEKANEKIDKNSQEDLARKVMSGSFNLEDFAKQIDMVSNMGSVSKIAKYLPGMPNVSPEAMAEGEKEMKAFKAIISSMTPKERKMPHILDASRKLRAAKGSGRSIEDVNKLMQRLQQSKQFAKMFKKLGKWRGRF